MSPPNSPSSGCTSHRRSSIWDYPSPTDCTAASEGAPSSAEAHDAPAAGVHNFPVGLGIPSVGPAHSFGGAIDPTEVSYPAIGSGLDEAQRAFIQQWLDGVSVFGPGPGVDDLEHTAAPPLGIVNAPAPVGQDHGLAPSVSSLGVELDDVPPSPTLLDTNPSTHNPSHFAPEDIDTALLGVGGTFN